MNSGSTDVSSDSLDIEEFSDSDSTTTESDEENPANQFSSNTHAGQLRTSSDPIYKSASTNILIPSKKRSRDRRSSESSNISKGEPPSSKFTSPPKTYRSRMDFPKKIGASIKPIEPFTLGSNDISPVEQSQGGMLYPGIGGYDLVNDGGIVDYSNSDSDDSEEEDEGDVEYSPTEMARLLSLNDQDMYESEGDEQEVEVEEDEGEHHQSSVLGEGIIQWSTKDRAKTRHDGAKDEEGTCTV